MALKFDFNSVGVAWDKVCQLGKEDVESESMFLKHEVSNRSVSFQQDISATKNSKDEARDETVTSHPLYHFVISLSSPSVPKS